MLESSGVSLGSCEVCPLGCQKTEGEEPLPWPFPFCNMLSPPSWLLTPLQTVNLWVKFGKLGFFPKSYGLKIQVNSKSSIAMSSGSPRSSTPSCPLIICQATCRETPRHSPALSQKGLWGPWGDAQPATPKPSCEPAQTGNNRTHSV